ncbi:hypothetical protein PS15m_009941 [Mucor circinelloides]
MAMDSTAELKHTYRIIQKKLDACQKQKRLIVQKKTVKRTLLQESQHVLQNHLVHALTENMPRKQRILLDNQQDNLIPIFSSGTTAFRGSQVQSNTAPDQPNHGYEMVQCRGWIMDRRVWLQATCHALHANVQQTHLCCLPNRFLPETTCLNKCSNAEYQRLFLCFDLLPDTCIDDVQSELRIYCNYQQGTQTLSTETCLIEWLDGKNLSWFDSLSISSSQVILQAYFPCQISVKNVDAYHFNQLMKHSQPLNDLFSYIQDHHTLIQIRANNAIAIYALNYTSLSFIVRLLGSNAKMTSITKDATRNLVVSTSEYYVSPNYKTRARVSLMTSQLFAI